MLKSEHNDVCNCLLVQICCALDRNNIFSKSPQEILTLALIYRNQYVCSNLPIASFRHLEKCLIVGTINNELGKNSYDLVDF